MICIVLWHKNKGNFFPLEIARFLIFLAQKCINPRSVSDRETGNKLSIRTGRWTACFNHDDNKEISFRWQSCDIFYVARFRSNRHLWNKTNIIDNGRRAARNVRTFLILDTIRNLKILFSGARSIGIFTDSVNEILELAQCQITTVSETKRTKESLSPLTIGTKQIHWSSEY